MFAEEKNNGEVKGGKYLEKQNLFFAEEEEGKCYHSGTNDRTRKDRTTQPMDYGTLRCAKLFFCGGEVKRRRKRSKIFGEGKYVFFVEKKNREGKGEWNFERGNIFFAEEKVKEGKYIFFLEEERNENGRWGNHLEKKNVTMARQ